MDLDALPQNQLPILYENRLAQQIQPKLYDYCDVHDLIAVVSAETQKVCVYRINGQAAFVIDRKDLESEVTALRWKPDGNFLSVGWSDGTCGVYSGEDGKLLRQSSLRAQPEPEDWRLENGLDENDENGKNGVCCIGWTSYVSRPSQSAQFSNQIEKELTTESWYDDPENAVPSGSSILELTRSITTIDVTNVLPRLSPLPTHALRFRTDEQKYTTQAGIDTLLDANRLASDTISTLVAIGTAGVMSVYLDDSVSLGAFNIQDQSSISWHASNPRCSSEVILTTSDNDEMYRLHHFDIPLETLSGSLLHVVAANTKRIQTIVGYVGQTVNCVQSDFTSNLQLPSRLINNITEELSEKKEGDLVTNLYELAMTGNFSPTMIDWLAETVKENNHKRWDKSINDMYNHIQNHIFINLIPALDRLTIATNAIRGHAKFHEDTDRFVSSEPLTALMDDIDSVRLLAQKLGLIIMTEHRQFKAFSKWMRVMIEIAVAGPGSKAAAEIEDREVPNLDDGLLLAYIKDTLSRSKLTPHLEQRPNASHNDENPLDIAENATRHHENILNALAKLDSSRKENEEGATSLLNLSDLTARLLARTSLAIRSISKWQSRMLTAPSMTVLNTALNIRTNVTVLDLKLSPSDRERADVETATDILVTSPRGQENCRISLCRVLRLHSKKYDFAEADYDFPSGEILHAKILDEQKCLVLFKQAEDGVYSLLSCDLLGYETQHFRWIKVLHSFTGGSGFAPSHFVVGGRRGKMVCVVFGRNGREWKVLDLNDVGHHS